MIKAGHVYKDGRGNLVHIEGPTRCGHEGFVYSAEGNHYRASDGAFKFHTITRDEDGRITGDVPECWEVSSYNLLPEPIGTHSDGGKGYGWSHSVCSVCYPTKKS